MIADKVALRVTPSQHRRMARWAECVRLTYNWALSEWLRQYGDYRAEQAASEEPESPPPKPTRNSIVHLFTVLRKAGRLPSWAHTPLALTRNRAVRDVDLAWRNHFAGRSRRPRPKRSTDTPSFYLHNQSVRFEGEFAEVQKLGTLRLARAPRYPLHRVQGATVRYEHGRWHIAIVRDLDRQRQRAPEDVVGIHIGAQATASSDGARLVADVMTDAERRRLRRLQRTLSRRGIENPKGRRRDLRGGRAVRFGLSKNQIKAVHRLNAFRGRIGRRSAARRHAFTRSVAARSSVVCVESVSAGQPAPDARARHRGRRDMLFDIGQYELRRQLGYKLAEHGGTLVTVEGVHTAGGCLACGAQAEPRRTAQAAAATWTCRNCSAVNDSDITAAVAIARRATADGLDSGAGDVGTRPNG